MTTPIANVTATYDGELVEVNDDIDKGAFSTLLARGDEIVVHEVLDEELVEDLVARQPEEWTEKVRFEDAGDDAEADGEADDEGGACNHCDHDDCDGEPAARVTLMTNQTLTRCEHSQPDIGDYVAGERVTEVEEL